GVRACLESSPAATPGVALNSAQEAILDQLLSYLVECALPTGDYVTVHSGAGLPRVYRGSLGLAPEWRDEPLGADSARLVSACLAARNNALAEPVTISMRGPGLTVPAIERELYDVYEGAFWADFFADEPHVKSCRVTAVPFAGRICSQGQDCGFTYMGDCADVCSDRDPVSGHYRQCEGQSAVISTYLSLSQRSRASDIDTSCSVSDGAVRCVGKNSHGQVGDGTAADRGRPTATIGLDSAIAEVSVGDDHSCAREDNGTLWCWGRNQDGALGDGTTTQSSTPVQVSTLGGSVKGLYTGRAHTCAVLGDGSTWCWGQDLYGQLGSQGQRAMSEMPRQVADLDDVARLATGVAADHTCAVENDGSLACWGRNQYGQLGDGSTAERAGPIRVSSDLFGQPFVEITDVCTKERGTCARKMDGTLWCWGDGLALPVWQFLFGGVKVAPHGLSCGANHICVLTGEGTVWCAGENTHGQLGYDSGGMYNAFFVPVSDLYDIRAVSAGTDHTCADDGAGQRWCWGSHDGDLFPYPLTSSPQLIVWPE
ncbi:MAG: hypothetical protein AAGC55_01325, partial [Myxococcota bacterium]